METVEDEITRNELDAAPTAPETMPVTGDDIMTDD
jgi:hypothetical protein